MGEGSETIQSQTAVYDKIQESEKQYYEVIANFVVHVLNCPADKELLDECDSNDAREVEQSQFERGLSISIPGCVPSTTVEGIQVQPLQQGERCQDIGFESPSHIIPQENDSPPSTAHPVESASDSCKEQESDD